MKKKSIKSVIRQAQPLVAAPDNLTVVSAGLLNGKWGVILSNGSMLSGVEEIVQAKPSYSDGYSITIKVWVPLEKPPITKPAFEKPA
jgi:hypothetical protein